MKRWRLDSIATTIALTIFVAIGLGFVLQPVVDGGLVQIGFPARQDPRDSGLQFYVPLFPAEVASLVQDGARRGRSWQLQPRGRTRPPSVTPRDRRSRLPNCAISTLPKPS